MNGLQHSRSLKRKREVSIEGELWVVCWGGISCPCLVSCGVSAPGVGSEGFAQELRLARWYVGVTLVKLWVVAALPVSLLWMLGNLWHASTLCVP